MIKTETTCDTTGEATENGSLRVCIQGYSGAFHEIAARHCFQGATLEIVPAHTFEQLVKMVEKGEETDIGLMAIENTLAGSLMHNYHLLKQSGLNITGETYLRIKQNLMALPGTRLADLKEVHSHPIAIQQCLDFFAKHPHIRLVETVDTALSARNIQEQQLKDVGAIASTLAASLYDMELLAEGIETNKKNHTRFLVLERAKQVSIHPDANKVSLCFSVDHEVGSLYKVLAVLAAYNVNLTKIQSAPIIGKPWEYQFFLDFVTEGKVGHQQAIEAIQPLTHDLHILGIYPTGEHFDE
ncbi:MAG: prephenate dehydratase [Saprospiraceae bacterium]|nr:MAG: prephenate dehydratase [Saprospiraceae bacterium]